MKICSCFVDYNKYCVKYSDKLMFLPNYFLAIYQLLVCFVSEVR